MNSTADPEKDLQRKRIHFSFMAATTIATILTSLYTFLCIFNGNQQLLDEGTQFIIAFSVD